MPSLEPVQHGVYTLRDLNTPAERRECEHITRRCWGVDDLEIIPASALTALQQAGVPQVGLMTQPPAGTPASGG